MPADIPKFDLYAELEVHPKAHREVIEAAYRALARLFHPDAATVSNRGRKAHEAD